MKKTLFIFATLLMTGYCMADDVETGNKARQDADIQKQGVKVTNYEFQKGDTILISEDTKQYLTGETPSTWVYYVRHIVQQNGGKRFPNGVLIQGINSWVDPSNLLLFHAVDQTPAATERQQADQPRVTKQQDETVTPVTPAVIPAVIPVQTEQPQQTITPAEGNIRQEEVTPPAKNDEVITTTPVQEQPAKDEQPAEGQTTVVENEPVVAPVLPLSEIDRFTIGLRGGVASMMHKTVSEAEGKWKPGFDVILDLQYAHYWQRGTAPSFGILTGLSVGYNRSTVTSKFDTILPMFTDADGDQVQYTLQGNAKEVDGQVMLEVPLMFSMITTKGFFLNIGPRVQLPVFNHYKQTISGGNISLYNQTRNVTVANEEVTGKLNADQEKMTGNGSFGSKAERKKLNLLLSAELGYEWKLKNNNALGLGVYADWAVPGVMDFKNQPLNELFTVGHPGGDKAADVLVNTTTQAYTADKALGFFDCGVKLNYSFDWIKR